MYASNEELLRDGECPESNCIEPTGHAGSHSGEAVPDWKDKLTPVERKEWTLGAPYSMAFTQNVVHSLAASRRCVERLKHEIAVADADDWGLASLTALRDALALTEADFMEAE